MSPRPRRIGLIAAVMFPLLAPIVIAAPATTRPTETLPVAGQVVTNVQRSELILHAVVQRPTGKPCIDAYGQRIQAFVGCRTAAGGDAKMADYFVFLVDVSTEQVYDGLIKLGAKTRVHYGMNEGHRRSGLKVSTRPEDFLQGDPIVLSIFWREGKGGGWVERPYQDFCTEQVEVDGQRVEKPWTPSFVFHGSGAIHASGTGCIACPCDCAGGIIADNRFPLYDPKPTVKFDTAKAPPAGTEVYVRIRPVTSTGGAAGAKSE